MGTRSSIQFLETALRSTSPFALSYTDPDQKWLIRKHLLSLLQDFPNLTLSSNTFIHNNGDCVNLLYGSGLLHVSNSTPSIQMTIWIHENYPYAPPMVFVSSNFQYPIRHHPLVESSAGATTSSYLKTWTFPRCNLVDLVKNLVKLFSYCHPYVYSHNSSFTHPSYLSKTEALDRLVVDLYGDMVALHAKNNEKMEEISELQVEMEKRADVATSILLGLEHERENLKGSVTKLTEEADKLVNWLRANDQVYLEATIGEKIEEAFEDVDKDSKLVIDCLAEDRSIEDLLYALDEALEKRIVTFDVYIRQVRVLAREQFFKRAEAIKLRGSYILHWPKN
ncbi:Ubiquitin E2 variant, N-terminal [Dillenia turbinata]|uniref:Ubiquitin E2 variant, N-terminal n=1 Tax=Dillenia turbinata TaxID=194707 RepID=A0AAN8ZKM0_9MAGN